VYPLWAFLQDAIVFIFILPRARIAMGSYGDAYTVLLFTIIHLPSPALTIAALVLAVVMLSLWRKYQSLIAIALVHGILGAVANKSLGFSMRIGKAWFD
jgi:membrane protease YdiL (CAAX protease family)